MNVTVCGLCVPGSQRLLWLHLYLLPHISADCLRPPSVFVWFVACAFMHGQLPVTFVWTYWWACPMCPSMPLVIGILPVCGYGRVEIPWAVLLDVAVCMCHGQLCASPCVHIQVLCCELWPWNRKAQGSLTISFVPVVRVSACQSLGLVSPWAQVSSLPPPTWVRSRGADIAR